MLVLYISPIPYNSNLVDLLMETMAVESNMGMYDRQIGGGPALGVYQMEPATLQCLKDNYIKYHPEFKQYSEGSLLDMKYATMVCALQYLRYIDIIDIPGTRWGWWLVYKKYYNSYKGKTTKEAYMSKARRYIDER